MCYRYNLEWLHLSVTELILWLFLFTPPLHPHWLPLNPLWSIGSDSLDHLILLNWWMSDAEMKWEWPPRGLCGSAVKKSIFCSGFLWRVLTWRDPQAHVDRLLLLLSVSHQTFILPVSTGNKYSQRYEGFTSSLESIWHQQHRCVWSPHWSNNKVRLTAFKQQQTSKNIVSDPTMNLLCSFESGLYLVQFLFGKMRILQEEGNPCCVCRHLCFSYHSYPVVIKWSKTYLWANMIQIIYIQWSKKVFVSHVVPLKRWEVFNL